MTRMSTAIPSKVGREGLSIASAAIEYVKDLSRSELESSYGVLTVL